MSTRPLALLLLAAGLTTGSLADRPTKRAPFGPNGPVVLTADFHVHAFPGDGTLPVWELRKEAARRGIDVIAVTNHNQSIAASLPAGGEGEELPLVIPGQEITSPEFHLVAVGTRRIVDWRLPLRRMIDDVHSQGGVAIAAHPVRDSWRVNGEDALSVLDGAEAVHARAENHSRGRFELREFYRNGRHHNKLLAAIGSSDFHTVAPLGQCFTYLFVDEITERGVLNAIRAGHTVATDNLGTFIGEAGLVERVQDAFGMSSRTRGPDRWAQIAVVMVLTALFGLVCFR